MNRIKEYKKFIIMMMVVFVLGFTAFIVTGSKTVVYGLEGYLDDYESVEYSEMQDVANKKVDSMLQRYAAIIDTVLDTEVTANFYYKAYSTDYFKQTIHVTSNLPAGFDESDFYFYSSTCVSSDGSRNCTIELYLNKEFPVMDEFGVLHEEVKDNFKERNITIVVLFASLAISLFIGIIIIKNIGIEVEGRLLFENIVRKIPFDILTLITCGVAIVIMLISWLGLRFAGMHATTIKVITGSFLSLLVSVLLALWMVLLRVKLKLKTGYKNLPTYRLMRKLFVNKDSFLSRVSSKKRDVILIITYVIVQTVGFCLSDLWDTFVPWVLAQLITLPFIVYFLRTITRIKEAVSQKEPDSSIHIDTKDMIGDLRDIADELNSLDENIEYAVAEQMKSARMKMELIANASRDLKTPLTSIINYMDLLSRQDLTEMDSKEYLEVLHIYSQRLKTLVEDIIDMSKASIGTVDVNLMEYDAGIILSQTVGEFEDRAKENKLELVLVKPEEPVIIIADDQLLSRVFENLMSNICKYSLENSRVYITLSTQNDEVHFEFKNISKKALTVLPENLMEMFVRGDEFRTTEGSGLGLSTARNLVELQNGLMSIDIDGDMFKIKLRFEAGRRAEQEINE